MNNISGQFRKMTWDPILIISQIIAVQAVIYVCLGVWIWIVASLLGSTKSLDYAFQYSELHVRDLGGKMVITMFLFNALIGALVLWWIVQRTKQCMDFACTAHLIHLLCCWGYNYSFPTSFSWWCLNIVSVTIMCIFGEFLCMRTELQAIPLGMNTQKTAL
ncbi:protein SYS1 homolog [Neodiprion virginianus]|uniref:protein SYS1 homolog n=1 Tax=Neodiprion fabricii TaxID=2872261 RepID=UPI001ED9284C|nr:protein SYS1 homolog [Neodiprion fabricii]XP_046411245.1 protein SYS1 homolog [Neodiprion fabricii]XP_046604159.1 protein SYS1 homolog [Neodiprion virginianus]XP_046604160.1 protein SYS1 homolog [Neodiprion virginianus]